MLGRRRVETFFSPVEIEVDDRFRFLDNVGPFRPVLLDVVGWIFAFLIVDGHYADIEIVS